MSLIGIETEEQCRTALDELLMLNQSAQSVLTKEAVFSVKSRLHELYKMGDGVKADKKMSKIERTHFWPAIREAYVSCPNLTSPQTWRSALSSVEDYLKYYRPKESNSQ